MVKELKTEIIEKYKLHEGDTGSPEVQVAFCNRPDRRPVAAKV